MIFISAGHNSKSLKIKQDPGAVNKQGVKEGDLTIEFRDLVIKELKSLGVNYTSDTDEESLKMYLDRIKTGEGSVIIEYHFDASINPLSGGTTSLIEGEADRLDKAFAKELVEATATYLHVKNRGTITEAESHRGRLGLMREEGIICLCELCFITNPTDLANYHLFKHQLAQVHALIIKRYEEMIP
jgi:N-acetylmuramoyl-L-alanine amidase